MACVVAKTVAMTTRPFIALVNGIERFMMSPLIDLFLE
jgi:hypothetical protein